MNGLKTRLRAEIIRKQLLAVISVFILLFLVSTAARAQDPPVSPEYPLTAHVIAVEMETAVTTTGSAGSTYSIGDKTFSSSDTRATATYNWHLMKVVIGDRLYGLSARQSWRWSFASWLEVGTYAFKSTKNGFEVQVRDSKGKIHKETLYIMSEEHAPPAAPATSLAKGTN